MSQDVENVLGAQNVGFLEELYADYVRDPASVPEDYRTYFASLGGALGTPRLGPSFHRRGYFGTRLNGAKTNGTSTAASPPSGNGAAARQVANAEAPPPSPQPAPKATAYAPPPSSRGAGYAPTTDVVDTLAAEDRALAEGSLRLLPVGSLRPVSESDTLDIAIRQDRVDQLVRAYRVRGHLIA